MNHDKKRKQASMKKMSKTPTSALDKTASERVAAYIKEREAERQHCFKHVRLLAERRRNGDTTIGKILKIPPYKPAVETSD